MKTADTIRIMVTAVIFVFMWFGHSWALYTAITLMTIGLEIAGWTLNKIVRR